MDILGKLQKLPQKTRQIILWVTVIIIGLALLGWWFNNFQQKLKSFKRKELKEQFQLPEIEIPNIEMPQIDEKE